MNNFVSVRFEPEGRKIFVVSGSTILEAAHKAGIKIRSECGGRGLCGKCKVIIVQNLGLDEISNRELEILEKSELSRGYRLACLTTVKGDLVVFIPPESRIEVRKIQAEGMERSVNVNPVVRKFHLSVSKPTLQDIKPDFERLVDVLRRKGIEVSKIDHEILKILPEILRNTCWNVTVTIWNDEKIISVEGGNTEKDVYGFAVDIGTSKVVGYLVNLTSGKVLSIKSSENPQIIHGEDIITRINYALTSNEALRELQRIVIETINQLILEACQDVNIEHDKIYEITVVGNTAMHHIFLGIQPKYLAFAPYTPAIKRAIHIKAESLGIKSNKSAYVYVLPVIAGFVGSDAVADVLATGIYESKEISLLMDIGTNGEVFVGNRDDIVSCSCAAGPAFEGMHIEFGMKAVTGAIEKLSINSKNYEVEYETIGNVKPVGICGSGIIDAVAEMFKCGIIDKRGHFNRNIQTERLCRVNGQLKFVIAWKDETEIDTHITISQKDIQEILLAKAAMHTGATILMREKKVTEQDVQHVYIAGAFGKYINPEGFNVADINVSSIMLNGTIPAEARPIVIGDYDNDSIPEPPYRPNWMGIDVNSSKIAVSIISKDKVLKQTYFGQDVSVKQLKFEGRRAKLQRYKDKGSSKAGLKLRRLSGRQRDYVRTRMWQTANEIVKLAKEFNANIAIERLRYLRKRKGEWSKRSRRKVNRIPYALFRHSLRCIAEREGVFVQEIKPNYTSQTCPRCGYVGKDSWRGYVYFRCVRCGYGADRDRVASLSIALRAAQIAKVGVPKRYFSSQSPEGGAPVSGHALKGEGCRWHQTTPSFKPTDSSVGC